MKILGNIFDLPQKKQEILELEDQMSDSDFWRDRNKALKVSSRVSSLKRIVSDFEEMESKLCEVAEFLQEDFTQHDSGIRDEIRKVLDDVDKKLADLELFVFLNDKYDQRSAILSIHAGAGGTDAQDWAQILLRMYTRFCERKGFKYEIVHISKGEEAGIKSAVLDIEGGYAYGYLKGEMGVHRLVRLSPFDADKARHTSFAYVEVLPEIEDIEVDINEKDLKIEAHLSSGPGGQNVQRNYSAVRIVHLPTGITVSVQSERSQLQNKEKALKILKSRIEKYYQLKQEEEKKMLKGEFTENAWGRQIRSYILHPYKLVKDHRTGYEEKDPDRVLDGYLDGFIEDFLKHKSNTE